MKILFVFHNVFFFRYFDGVIRNLRNRGHEVIIAAGLKRMTKGYTDRALRACIQESGCLEEEIIQPKGLSMIGAMIRDINGYANYFRSNHPSPVWAVKWKEYLPQKVRWLLKFRPAELLLRASWFRWLLKKLESKWKPERAVVERLRKDKPDVVVACPFIWTMSADADYIKAAAMMKIPTVVAVASWDHLAGKGLFPIIPDVTMVWNDEMAKEAFDLQDIPEDRIVTTGSPPFDFWFDAVPTMDRAAFYREVGLVPDSPFIVYLCSSRPIAGNSEPLVVRDLVEKLKANEATKRLQIIVRPYPSMAKVWDGVEIPHVKIWPQNGDWPDTNQARQDLFHSLYHSVAVVGINTTAMLEANVINRPCLTLMTKEFESSQTGRAHFQQLLRGGFLETANDLGQATDIIAGLLDKNDSKTQQRAKFVKYFFRPGGIDLRASDLAAQVIEMAARGEKGQHIRAVMPGQWKLQESSNA